MSKQRKQGYSLPVRILAVALTVLVTSGILTYLVMFIMELFGL